ncbi:MAG: anti-sigma factor [Proteobacteria bacterium]|nr:anti-sigma factor [Pseudomonadota bacterium]MBI3496819.1 anti-sigma factor [Pseudomonadota bacterium]
MTEPTRPIGELDLNAYVDGALAPERLAEVERHLEINPEDAARVADYRRIAEAVRRAYDPVLLEALPDRLKRAVEQPGRSWAKRLRAVAASIALFGLGLGTGWLAHEAPTGGRISGALARQAVDAHRLFVAEVRHPVEVAANEEEHLVAWLSKRLGQPLKVPRLASYGFQLVGGRLLPSDGQPAAQFMYENASGQRLTLYLRASPDNRETAFRFTDENGVKVFYWLDGPIGCALSGDLDRDRLLPIARTVYTQITG